MTPFYEEETEESRLAQGAAYLRQVLDRLGDPGYLTVAGETILWLAEDPPGRPAALPQRLEAVTAALPQSAYFPALQVGVGAAFGTSGPAGPAPTRPVRLWPTPSAGVGP